MVDLWLSPQHLACCAVNRYVPAIAMPAVSRMVETHGCRMLLAEMLQGVAHRSARHAHQSVERSIQRLDQIYCSGD